ncbi:uncharacterized protein LOC142324704 isoform X1 [Lycorma delicatula]|uniref:uncharacterized protein LOC142324704 isoform X1 n=1 Tax=Lycorma delicatula TaxID=130591 RepID=UPI003F50DFF1
MERLIPVSWTHEEHGLQAWTALSYLLYVNNNLSRAAYLAQKRLVLSSNKTNNCRSILVPALGLAWSNLVTTRLQMIQGETDNRALHVIFSPNYHKLHALIK